MRRVGISLTPSSKQRTYFLTEMTFLFIWNSMAYLTAGEADKELCHQFGISQNLGWFYFDINQLHL